MQSFMEYFLRLNLLNRLMIKFEDIDKGNIL